MSVIFSVIFFLICVWFVITMVAIAVKVKREVTAKDDNYYRQRENGEKALETLGCILVFPVIILCALSWFM